MDDCHFTADPDTIITSGGISTCIVFAVRGFYEDDDEKQVLFCGLHHWSGFIADSMASEKNQCLNIISQFFMNLRTDLEIEDEERITISSLDFIGGEKAQMDGDEVVVSGTEREVTLIQEVIREYDFSEDNMGIGLSTVTHQHFLTSGNDSITVTLRINGFAYTHELPNDNQTDEHPSSHRM